MPPATVGTSFAHTTASSSFQQMSQLSATSLHSLENRTSDIRWSSATCLVSALLKSHARSQIPSSETCTKTSLCSASNQVRGSKEKSALKTPSPSNTTATSKVLLQNPTYFDNIMLLLLLFFGGGGVPLFREVTIQDVSSYDPSAHLTLLSHAGYSNF